RLPFLSGQLGHNIAFNGSVKAAVLLADDLPDGDMFTGRTHPGMISYQFLESHGITISAAKAMPLELFAGIRLRVRDDRRRPSWWGERNVALMEQCRHRLIALYTMGLTPPSARLTIAEDGSPVVSLEPSPVLRHYHERTEELLESILVRNGCRLVDIEFLNRDGAPHGDLFFSTAHQVGSCRMADSREH